MKKQIKNKKHPTIIFSENHSFIKSEILNLIALKKKQKTMTMMI